MKIQITYQHPELDITFESTFSRRQTLAAIAHHNSERGRGLDDPAQPLPEGLESVMTQLSGLFDEHKLRQLDGHVFIFAKIAEMVRCEMNFAAFSWPHKGGIHRLTLEALPH